MEYSQTDIDQLVTCPKQVSTPPRKELRLVGADWRNDMKMVSDGHPGEFNAFFRRSEDFPENFSIGLSYDPKDGSGEITLFRCNGPHGVFNGTFDPTHPHWEYHIHTASEAAVTTGLKPEKYAASTTAYASYEEAVRHFVKLINLRAAEVERYFPDRTAQTEFPFGSGGA